MGINWKRRSVTQDRAEAATEVFTTTKLGSKQSKTPEGFLLCEDVPIARVGDMIYGPQETPIEVGKDGRAVVTRDATALFSKSAISSYQGKPVVNDHPDVDVTPTNWKGLAVGICMNPRRGVGDDSDVMLADLLITDAETIRDVQAGKREVSAGYEADYEQTGDGHGRQTNIIGNHVALVERGRCGPRCAIGDHHPTSLKENSMKQKTRRVVSDAVKEAVRRSFKDAEEAALEQLGNSGIPDGPEPGEEPDGDEAEGNHTHIHIHSGESGGAPAPAGAPAAAEGDPAGGAPAGGGSVEDRLTALEGQMGQILAILQGGDEPAPAEGAPAEGDAPAGDDVTQDEIANTGTVKLPDSGDSGEAGDMSNVKTGDRKSTTDSAGLETSFRQLLSDAEVLLPGYRMPTFDAKSTRQKTVDSMCSLRKQVLGSIYITADGKALVDGVAGAPVDLAKQDCAQTAVLFRAAAGAKKLLNNRTSVGDGAHRVPISGAPAPSTSLSALNAQNKAFWASQGKK